ncbi:MAG TPA: YggT family protein [Actinomycetales bacterium]|nr:YggT family protein [Actinomycetales bacterium]
MSLLFSVLYFVAFIYFILLIARLVLDWVQVLSRDWTPKGVVLVLAEIVYTATDPPLRAVRRVLKPIRIGPVMLDLGFMVVFIAVIILMRVFQSLAAVSA